MGTWGVKIYDSDEASEIKEDYERYLIKGKNAEEATKEMLEKYKLWLDDEEDAPMFWCVLASVQWDYGRLVPEVKEKAIKYLEAGYDLKQWEEEASKRDYEQRKKQINKLIEKLNSKQPQPKKLRKPFVCDWKIGDVYAYKLTGEIAEKNPEYLNKYVVFQKIDEEEIYNGDVNPYVMIYDQIFEEVPTLDEVIKYNYITIEYSTYSMTIHKVMLSSRRERKFKKENLVYVGNSDIKAIDNICLKNDRYILWDDFEWEIIFTFNLNSLTSYNKRLKVIRNYKCLEEIIKEYKLNNVYYMREIENGEGYRFLFVLIDKKDSIGDKKRGISFHMMLKGVFENDYTDKEFLLEQTKEILDLRKYKVNSQKIKEIAKEYFSKNEGYVQDFNKEQFITIETYKYNGQAMWKAGYKEEDLKKHKSIYIYIYIDAESGKILGRAEGMNAIKNIIEWFE